MLKAFTNLGQMQWGEWLTGIWSSFISAAAGAGSTAIGTMVVDPVDFNIHAGLSRLLQVMAFSALIPGTVSMLKYLQMHPTPDKTPVQAALIDAKAANVAAGDAIGKAQDAQAQQLPKP